MADTRAKINTIIRDYIDRGRYFVINRARQYGKTTTLSRLQHALFNTYLVLRASFEGLGEIAFSSEEEFVSAFIDIIHTCLERANIGDDILTKWDDPEQERRIRKLPRKIINLITSINRPIVLMIDEVDKSAYNQLFLDFLGMLRDMYLNRNEGFAPAFHSVILAGVHDIRNLRAMIRPDSEHAYNSPWNIAASFDVDMSFSHGEIISMLSAYEEDYHAGMNVCCVSERLHYHTSGYPFLVSFLCKLIHEDKLSWACDGVDTAVRHALNEKNTLFDDLIKNLQNHPGFAKLVERIVLEGKTVDYNPDDPSIDLGVMYGIFARDDSHVRISNRIFSTRLMNYFISISKTGELAKDRSERDASLYIRDGVLDFDKVIERFGVFMFDEYRDQDSAFIEREARRLLLGYIKPIINGYGQYYLEPQICGGKEIDILVQYQQAEHIVEVKIWRGEAYERRAYDQIAGYVKARRQQIGYVVSFCNLQKAPRQGSAFTHNGVEIHETIIAYKDVV
jgi:hypothetical protein